MENPDEQLLLLFAITYAKQRDFLHQFVLLTAVQALDWQLFDKGFTLFPNSGPLYCKQLFLQTAERDFVKTSQCSCRRSEFGS